MSDRILIVQLGLTGLSLARHFRACGCQITVVDERAAPPQLAALQREMPGQKVVKVGSYAELGALAAEHDATYVSPGVAPARLPAGLSARGDLECFANLFWARWPNGRRPQLVAITGTNGKSTVAKLVRDLLNRGGERAEAVGNIGIPLLDAWNEWQLNGFPKFIVLELSSFQLARFGGRLRADVACLVNCAADHLDWHGSHAAYVEAKRSVYAGAALGVFNRNETDGAELAGMIEQGVGFGRRGRGASREWNILDRQIEFGGRGSPAIDVAELIGCGIMPESACAALTIARHAARWQELGNHVQDLRQLRGLAHRFEHVASGGGVSFVNDSKATNVSATSQALASLDASCVLIAGGQDKGQDFAALAEAAGAKVAHAVVLGEAATRIEAAFAAAGLATSRARDMAAAVAAAHAKAQEEGVGYVMLSPACSSIDMFDSYVQRGEVFAKSCLALVASGEKNALA